jgi:hypothetical protein
MRLGMMQRMGRIGRSYPRFEQAQKPAEAPSHPERDARYPVLGAIIGVLCALGLIGWLLSR